MNKDQNLDTTKKQLASDLNSAKQSTDVEKLREQYLGKSSPIQKALQNLKELPAEERKAAGGKLNQLKQELETQINDKLTALREAEYNSRLAGESLDLDLPPLAASQGYLHPVTQELERIVDIFQRMGFSVQEPFMVDDEYNTFTALNIPEGHPARDMWDTIYLEDDNLLITHTSSMQNRVMSSKQPPIRTIVPGKCFRNEATDATHEHSFYQLEGIYVDKNIKLSDLIGTLSEFLNQYFETKVPIKIQPTFFPFVEPALEIMMPRPKLGGKLDLENFNPETTDWLEVIPCGPIHPNVLKEAGIDATKYSGFAWGMGLERLIMIKRQINDLRYFHSGRIDFLNQF
ncbi:MAG: phenylalanine--tRNA ligase subunit alpha [Candidatus Doudnabacteria bacterium]|nr:phenylalanine--tRNA ligase subunit alpha [Candidatus Doudnabacteria bacterium]